MRELTPMEPIVIHHGERPGPKESDSKYYLTTRPSTPEDRVRLYSLDPTKHPNQGEIHDMEGRAIIKLSEDKKVAIRRAALGNRVLSGYLEKVLDDPDGHDAEWVHEEPRYVYVELKDIGQEGRKTNKPVRKIGRRTVEPDEMGRTNPYDPEYGIPQAFYSQKELDKLTGVKKDPQLELEV